MSQATDWSVPLIGPATPTAYSGRLDESLDALLSAHAGTTRPAYAVVGTEWVSTAIAGKLKYYVFDGVNDRLVLTIDTSTGAITYGDGTTDDVLATKAPKSVHAVKSGNYTAVAGDAGATIRFTAAATLTLTAAAALGNGWPLNVIADGGAVTIDPNASETINGLPTLVVPLGASAEIICDGTSFFTVIKPSAWEVIGVYNPSAVASVDITNLGSFKFLRAYGILSLGTAGLIYRTSTNNGSSYDASASDYSQQSNNAIGNSNGAAFASAASGAITTQTGTTAISFETLITNWNVNGNCFLVSKNFVITAAQSSEIISSKRNDNTARNALRFLVTTGTMTGTIILEGVRG